MQNTSVLLHADIGSERLALLWYDCATLAVEAVGHALKYQVLRRLVERR
jgi:hypothetical protein